MRRYEKRWIEKRVAELCEPVIRGLDMNMVAVNIESFRGHSRLTIYIDREGGVTVNDCARVSKILGDILDVEDPIESSYTLTVSSPGPERPLWKDEDFDTFTGRRLRIRVSGPSGGSRNLTGILKGLSPCGGMVLEKDGEEIFVAFDDIRSVHLHGNKEGMHDRLKEG